MKLLHRSRPIENVPLPSELEPNVRVLPSIARPAAPENPKGRSRSFLVRDGDGNVRDTGAVSRQEALRSLGILAVRGVSAPLILLFPDGEPTGDRIS